MCRQSASICPIKSPTRQHRLIGQLALRLRTLADPRHRRGKRHSFVSVLLVACSAVLTGARSFAAIGQWALSAPQDALARLGARAATVFGVRIAPSTATIRRVLNAACPGGLADLLGYDPTGATELNPDELVNADLKHSLPQGHRARNQAELAAEIRRFFRRHQRQPHIGLLPWPPRPLHPQPEPFEFLINSTSHHTPHAGSRLCAKSSGYQRLASETDRHRLRTVTIVRSLPSPIAHLEATPTVRILRGIQHFRWTQCPHSCGPYNGP